MVRKAIVDKEKVLSMLREGETTQHIAENFKVSRQAVDIYRRDFIKKGLLPDQRAVRKKRKALKENISHRQNSMSHKEYSTSRISITLDEQIDLIIKAFNALKRLPQLEKEVEAYKQQYDNALQEIERLKKTEKKRLVQESRWLETQRHNGANSALLEGEQS
jgi:transposase